MVLLHVHVLLRYSLPPFASVCSPSPISDLLFFLLAFLSAFLDVILFCSLSLTKPLLLVRVCLLPCRNSLFLCNRFDLADCSLVAFGFPCVRLQSILPFCVRISILHVRPVPGLIFNDLYSTCVSSDRFHLEEISCH